MTLLVGSLVIFNSGSPVMTVCHVEKPSMSVNEALQSISCVWFDGGDVKHDVFPAACLKEVKIG